MRTRNPEQKKNCIASVARRLFVEKGFYAVTIPEIVAESGTSTGSVYRYYGSKFALAQQLYEDSAHEFNILLAQRLEAQTGAYKRAEAVAELLLDLAEQDSTLVEYLFLSRHQDFLGKYSPVIGRPSNCVLCQIFEEGISNGEVAFGDPLAKAIAFLGVILKNIEVRLRWVCSQPRTELATKQIIQRAWNAAYQ